MWSDVSCLCIRYSEFQYLYVDIKALISLKVIYIGLLVFVKVKLYFTLISAHADKSQHGPISQEYCLLNSLLGIERSPVLILLNSLLGIERSPVLILV